eukprot:356594-Chlamydomonas_euryale.AAC.4
MFWGPALHVSGSRSMRLGPCWQVLGPSCPKATGDCQQLLQLLVGPLLSHIASNMLQAADACDRCDMLLWTL